MNKYNILNATKITIVLLFFIGCSDFMELGVSTIRVPDMGMQLQEQWQIPVVNIHVDEEEFAYMFENYWADLEVFGDMKIIRKNNVVFETENARFTIKGLGSRSYDLKSLGVRFDASLSNEDGKIISPVAVLPHHSIENVEAIRFRNSGQDFLSSRNGTMIKDIAYTRLAIEAGLNLDVMYPEQVMVFVNDHFYGILNLRTDSNARGIAGLYQTRPESITLAKLSFIDNELAVELQNGDYARIKNFLEAIEEQNISFLKAAVDIHNFIDYTIFNTFIANRDWPYANVRFFAVDDQPFRFFVFDLDLSNISYANSEPVALIMRGADNIVRDIFLLLYEEEEFQQAFYTRYRELIASGVFDPQVFRDITNDYASNIETVMPYHIQKYDQPGAMAEWYRNIELLNVHYEKRFDNIREMMFD